MRVQALVAMVALSGCVDNFEWTLAERCSTQNMVVAGVTMSSDETIAGGVGTGGWAVARATSSGESLSCRPATTVDEMCRLAGAQASAAIKSEWDSTERNALIFLGYVAAIVPGIVASVLENRAFNRQWNAAWKAQIVEQNACLTRLRPRGSGPPSSSQ